MLQTSARLNHLIDHSTALCEAIYYTPAAPRTRCGKLLIRLINALFRAVTPHPRCALFVNMPPAFQPHRLLSRVPILLDSADSFGALTSTVALQDPENLLQMLQCSRPSEKGSPRPCVLCCTGEALFPFVEGEPSVRQSRATGQGRSQQFLFLTISNCV